MNLGHLGVQTLFQNMYLSFSPRLFEEVALLLLESSYQILQAAGRQPKWRNKWNTNENQEEQRLNWEKNGNVKIVILSENYHRQLRLCFEKENDLESK